MLHGFAKFMPPKNEPLADLQELLRVHHHDSAGTRGSVGGPGALALAQELSKKNVRILGKCEIFEILSAKQ